VTSNLVLWLVLVGIAVLLIISVADEREARRMRKGKQR